ncbi:hypothetical protein B0H66DRAFT_195848 [Apodospora peruviana]|uniref:MOZ protein represents a chromatin-associated acetyltransferase n=1 Tax=Apodospora peruviana TaxID=516989 RepID=A0AAE0IC67_9PEZI|nr:hypothetical protein B0H66DRAFT_195848 [Apodospora peruviana]
MAASRLTFLYPHLFRASGGRLSEPALQIARQSSRHKAVLTSTPLSCQQPAASLTTSRPGQQAAFAKRAGKAVEPQPSPDQSSPQPTPETKVAQEKEAGKQQQQSPQAQPQQDRKSATRVDPSETMASPSPGPSPRPETKAKSSDSRELPTKEELPPPSASLSEPPKPEFEPQATTTSTAKQTGGDGSSTGGAGAGAGRKGISGPMDTILHMGPPEEAKHKPPHLTPPPYVHHFDSYSLVKQLTIGGYTQEQAITAMKAVRGLLASNLDVAQEGLVSKSDVENETYLFRAACSELSTEVKNNRRVADEHLRQQRTHLQHEVDILTQRLNQELLTLNDNVRGMFNDRRMVVREEQKAVDSAIQQINYKISVMLNSDARSEIEGLRWVLIRRSVLGIVVMAFLTLSTLRYASYVTHERQKEKDKKRREKEKAKSQDGRHDNTAAPEAAAILAAN